MTNPINALGPMTSYGTSSGSIPTNSGVDGSTQTNGSNTTGNTTKTAAKGGSMLDPQTFLQLLVAQLKYQDPSNPVDTSAFMSQTAMLSQVQTMDSMSGTLSALADAQQAQAATGLIGKQVGYLDAQGMPRSGIVDSASLLATGATLSIGGTNVALSSVQNVTNPTANPLH